MAKKKLIPKSQSEWEQLQERRQYLLKSLKGNHPAAIYGEVRSSYAKELIEVQRKLNELHRLGINF